MIKPYCLLKHVVNFDATSSEDINENVISIQLLPFVDRCYVQFFFNVKLSEVVEGVLWSKGKRLWNDVGEVLVNCIREIVHVEAAAAFLTAYLTIEVLLRLFIF